MPVEILAAERLSVGRLSVEILSLKKVVRLSAEILAVERLWEDCQWNVEYGNR